MKISSHRFIECLTTRTSKCFGVFFKSSKWETINSGSPHYDPAFLSQHPVTKTWIRSFSSWEEWQNLAHSVYQHPLCSIVSLEDEAQSGLEGWHQTGPFREFRVCPKQRRNYTPVWTKENKANENQARNILAGKHRAQAVDTESKKLKFATLIE